MSDLLARFASLDTLNAPDLRSQIDVGRSRNPVPDRGGGGRIAAAVVALVLSLAGAMVAARAFLTESPDRERTTLPTPEHLDPRAVAEIRLPDYATTIAAGEGQVWVGIQTSNQEGLVARVDPGSNRLLDPVPIDAVPLPFGVSAGAVWVRGYVENGPDRLVKIDAARNEMVANIELPEYAGHAEATESAIWVTVHREADDGESEVSLLRFDPITAQLVERISIPGADFIDSTTIAEGSLWLANYGVETDDCAHLYRVEESTQELMTVPAGPPRGGGPGGRRIVGGQGSVWINCSGSSPEHYVLRQIDARTGKVGPTFDVEERFAAPIGVTVEGVWVRTYDDRDRVDLVFLDPDTGTSFIAVENTGSDFGGVVDSANDAIWLLETEALVRVDLHH